MTMQSNESDADNTTTASFWEPNQYIRTVKRVDNANKLCTEHIIMIQERSDIERGYAANLQKFALRLETFLKSGIEYGTGSNLISGLAKEARDTAVLHSVCTLLNKLYHSCSYIKLLDDFTSEYRHRFN